MKTTGFIARRYLFSKKHVSLISTLTIISITGVTIGTALLIIVLSVFNGFFEVIKGLLLNNDPDIRIEQTDARAFIYNKQLRRQIEDIPEVRIISPYVAGKALLAAGKNNDQVVRVKGVQQQSFNRLSNLKGNISSGQFDLGVHNKHPGLVINARLMAKLGLQVHDEIALLSAKGMRKSLTQFSMPRTYRFDIRGSYSLTEIVENPAVYISLPAAQRLFNDRNTISGIDLRLKDNDQAESVKKALQKNLNESYKVSTWYDLQKPLYDIMYLEKWGAYLILMIIVLVAVLNIVGSLSMIVIQKSRDIGVLLTMGYTPANIKQIFIKQGFYIGLIGCGLGGAIGLILSWLQQYYGLIKLSSAFVINAYPVSIHPIDVILVMAGSMGLCLLASWYPSKRAAMIEPADAVRFE